jgi:sugar transferase EpsL
MSAFYARRVKRALDIIAAAVALIVLSPVIALTALAVRMFLGSPVLFRQLRPGLHERPFTVMKFRTLADVRDATGTLLPDGQRMTALGRIVRTLSLDELPQLMNVLRGDMSLVGPRPLLMQYLTRYSPEQRRRHEVRPGVTGWAQVNGRNALSWEEKFRYDVWYVDHLSFALDVKILLKSVWVVMRGFGISQSGRATADEFMGGGQP